MTLPSRALGARGPVAFRPALEPLGDRLTPDAAPVITNFTVCQVSGDLYQFSGQVIDESPYGLTVEFSGAPVSLQGQRVEVSEDGWFTLQIELQTDGTDNGNVGVTCEDWYGNVSNTPYVYVSVT